MTSKPEVTLMLHYDLVCTVASEENLGLHVQKQDLSTDLVTIDGW